MCLSTSIPTTVKIKLRPHLFIFMTYVITLVEPTRFLQRHMNLQSTKFRYNDKSSSMGPRDVKHKNWEDFRRQVLNNKTPLSANIFQERNLGERLIQRSRRSIHKLKSTNSRKALITCKLQNYNLAIMNDGKVVGDKNSSSPNVLLKIDRYGGNLASIQHPKSKRYIAMNSNGNVYSTKTFSDEVLFKCLTVDSLYHQFASYKYKYKGKDMLIGVRNDGQIKKGKKVSSTHKSTLFLVSDV